MQLVEQKTGGETGDTGADDGDLFFMKGVLSKRVCGQGAARALSASAEQAQQPDEATGKWIWWRPAASPS
jgi:hypothetical protein